MVWPEPGTLPALAAVAVPNQTAPAPAGAAAWWQMAGLAGVVVIGIAVIWLLVRRTRPSDTPPMTFMEHFEELRRRLAVVAAAWLLGTILSFTVRIDRGPGLWPSFSLAVQDNLAAQVFQRIATHLVPEGVQLVVTRPIDGFVAQLSIAGGIGFIVALPVLLIQAGLYLGPALHAHERRALKWAFGPFLVLFAAGVAFCWFLVLPLLLVTLYGYGTALGAQPLLVISDLVGFTITMIVTFGLAFQAPLVMYILARVGIANAATYARLWRHAMVAILIFSAVITDPTVISQVLVAAPLVALYFLGILAARTVPAARRE